jgi:hypothetical protein
MVAEASQDSVHLVERRPPQQTRLGGHKVNARSMLSAALLNLDF